MVKLYFKSLESIADSKGSEVINFVGIVLRIGVIGEITLKSGEKKNKRNLIMCDESNMTIVVCFWSEKHIKELDNKNNTVLALIGARVSDFSGKSINVSDDGRLFFDPHSVERTAQLHIWFE